MKRTPNWINARRFSIYKFRPTYDTLDVPIVSTILYDTLNDEVIIIGCI